MGEDYYVLKKRTDVRQGASIALPSEVNEMLASVPFEEQQVEQMEEEQDDEDSNRESNPDYDYPEEDSYSSENEGIIRGGHWQDGSEE